MPDLYPAFNYSPFINIDLNLIGYAILFQVSNELYFKMCKSRGRHLKVGMPIMKMIYLYNLRMTSSVKKYPFRFNGTPMLSIDISIRSPICHYVPLFCTFKVVLPPVDKKECTLLTEIIGVRDGALVIFYLLIMRINAHKLAMFISGFMLIVCRIK